MRRLWAGIVFIALLLSLVLPPRWVGGGTVAAQGEVPGTPVAGPAVAEPTPTGTPTTGVQGPVIISQTVPVDPPTATGETVPAAQTEAAEPPKTVPTASKPAPKRASPDAPPIGRERFLVLLKPGSSVTATAGLQAQAAAPVVETIPQIGLMVIEPDAQQRDAALQVYRSSPSVQMIERDELVYANDTPNDPYYSRQWALAKVEAGAAWDSTKGSSSVKLAVLDCGIYNSSSRLGPGHPDINAKIVAERDFTNSSYGTDDMCDHGTHVAGIAAAVVNNGAGIAGLGRETKILNGKVLDDEGSGYSSWAISGIVWAADNGAKVINMSFGSSVNTCSSSYQQAVDYAWNKGAVIIAAAGNDAKSYAGQPANCSRVLSVAATDRNDQKAPFSNYGSATVDVAAPGVAIFSLNYSGGYVEMSGTSMATPLVAGLASLIWSVSGVTSNQAVINRITQSADAIAGTGTNWAYGRVNARKAVASSTPNVQLSASPTSVTSGQSVTAAWSNLTASGNDTISLHAAGAADSDFTQRKSISGGSGQTTFTAPSTAGTYQFRLFSNGTRVATSNNFAVATTPRGSVTASDAWTNDGNDNSWTTKKSSFRAGDKIRYVALVVNDTGSTATATLSWDVQGPGGQILASSGPQNTNNGSVYWAIGDTLPTNLTAGTYTFRFAVGYNGSTSTKSQTFTIQDPGSVTVESAWTNDGGQSDWSTQKTVFRAGEKIRYVGTVKNTIGRDVSAQLRWTVSGPSGQIIDNSGNYTIRQGTYYWALPDSLSAQLTPGTYTYNLIATYNGTTSQRTAKFTFLDSAITAEDAWLNDGNDDSWHGRKSSFKGNDKVRYVATVKNDTGSTTTVRLTWRATTSGGQILDYASDVETPVGTVTWGLPVTMPKTGKSGTYTFRFDVTYNGRTSSRTSDFTLTLADPNPNPVGLGKPIRIEGGSSIYLLIGNVKRPFTGSSAFSCRGYDWGAIETVSAATAAGYDTGSPLDPPNYCTPHNRTFKGDEEVHVLIERNGQAFPVVSVEHFECWGFEWPRIKFVSQRYLTNGDIPRGNALGFPSDCLKNGTFVIDGDTWYEMADGFLRKIADPVTLTCRQERPGSHPIVRRSVSSIRERLGAQMPYRQGCDPPADGTVVGNLDTGGLFLVDNGKKRYISSTNCRGVSESQMRNARWLADSDVDDYFSANPGYWGPPVQC